MPTLSCRILGLSAAAALLAPALLSGCSGEDDASVVEGPFACQADTPISVSPLRRLSLRQYRNSLRDLLAHYRGPADAAQLMDQIEPLVAIVPHDDPSDHAQLDQALGQSHADGFYEVAGAVAAHLTTSPEQLTALAGDCATNGDPADDADCVRGFVEQFGLRALRHPLSDAEIALYAPDAHNSATDVSPQSFADRISVMLQAPHFVYHVELGGEPIDGDTYALGAYELASRLSYHFWQTAPDQALLDAAADGSLLSEDGYRAQVERLWSDARTRVELAQLVRVWLHLDEVAPIGSLDPQTYEDWTRYQAFAGDMLPHLPQLRDEMVQEIFDLIDYTIWTGGGSYHDIWLSDRSFARGSGLAAVYGVSQWDGEAPPGALPDGRAGLLSRAAMVATAHHLTRPIHKGVLIYRHLMCEPIEDPPADAEQVADELSADLPEIISSRDRADAITDLERCDHCHDTINPYGFTLEGFDALGRSRSQETIYAEDGAVLAQLPVNTEASVFLDGDWTDVAGAAEVQQLAIDSGKAQNCFARHYFRFTYGRQEHDHFDGCALNAMIADLDASTSMSAMLRNVALRPEFKQRRKGE